ncbi:MAG: hypothetical protein ACRDVE_18085 [Actinocrinis sp.]
MTDHVIIEPDGTLTEGDGYPADEVGCHGYSGQTLWKTRRYVNGNAVTLRMIACDVCMVMEGHAPNPVAQDMLRALGYGGPLRGRIAIVRLGWQNELLPLSAGDLTQLRTLARGAQAAQELRQSGRPVDEPKEGSQS